MKTYLQWSSNWRKYDEPGQLVLSYVNPYKPVSSDTIVKWIKKVLLDAGINTQVFTSLSTHSASTSKANSNGANVIKNIIKMASYFGTKVDNIFKMMF